MHTILNTLKIMQISNSRVYEIEDKFYQTEITIFRNFDVKTRTNKVMLQLYSPSYHDDTLPSPSRPKERKIKKMW